MKLPESDSFIERDFAHSENQRRQRNGSDIDKSSRPRAPKERRLWKADRLPLTIAVSILLGLLVVGLSTNLPVVGILIVAVVATFMFPTTMITVGVSWAILCRPSQEVIHMSVAGVTISELDGILVLSLLAALRLGSQQKSRKLPLFYWIAIFAWPLWMVVRSFLPHQGLVQFASPFVDLHLLAFFFLALPINVLIQIHGWGWAVKWLAYLGYIACFISVAGWLGSAIGVVPFGQTALLEVSAGPLVSRPGGEILVPILALLLLFGKAPLLLNSRFLSMGLVLAEILASQTLSIVLGIAVAALCAVMFTWRSTPFGTRVALVGLVCIAGLFATGTLGSNSRFNLSQRSGEDSAQYRVSEFAAVSNIIRHDPTVAVVGTGPGSLVTFQGVAIHSVKRDTHNVFLTVVLKSGLLGLSLFVLPFIIAGLWCFGGRRKGMGALFGAYVAVGVVSISVPFLWTTGGILVVTMLGLIAARSRSDALPLQNAQRRSVGI